MGDKNLIRTLGDYSKPSHEGYRNTIDLPVGNNVVPVRSDTIRLGQNGCSFHELRSEDPNQHLKDFLKLVDLLDLDDDNRERTRLIKAITLPQDVSSTFDHHLIELDNQVQRLMKAHLTLIQSTQVNKITTLCEICSGPNDTQYCMENLEQAFVDYASSRTDEARDKWYTFKLEFGDTYNPSREVTQTLGGDNPKIPKVIFQPHLIGSNPTVQSQTVLSTTPIINQIWKDLYPTSWHLKTLDCPGQEEEGNLGYTNSNPYPQPDPLASIVIEQVRKLNLMLESLGLVPRSPNSKFVCSKEDDGEVMFIKIIQDDDEPQNEGPNESEGATTEGPTVKYFDSFPTRDELTYHRYLMSGPIPSIFLRNPIIMKGCHSNLKIPCNIGHVHIEKAYIDLDSSLNIMTRMMYNWIMRRKLDPKENSNEGVRNFTGRIKGMHVFIGNFTYIVDFMIIEDISSIIDPRLSQVVLGKTFMEISNMTHDPQEGVVRFINVIFDEKKLGSSEEVSMEDSRRTI
uniref:MAK10-like protein n=1 Tax=Tanacetum cinerariifolium TaxID=118510 RepID=A0A6L2L7I6_TANCI|nr:MAK10-like protein [Tanacetum cinerariifolium]